MAETDKMETKRVGRIFDDVGEENDEFVDYRGVKCRVIKGYIATWDRDSGNDKFHPGCFKSSLEDWRKQGRDVKVREMHGDNIGVYPIDRMKEDSVGLFGEAFINMEIEQGREAYSKAKMGIYDRKSIGFAADRETTKGKFPYGRDIYKAHIFEGSLVDEPMNINARITSVKCIQDFQDLPLADGEQKFDRRMAKLNVAEWSGAEDSPNDDYHKAFLVVGDGVKFSSHQLQIADVVDGELKAVPKAIYKAASMLALGKGIEGMTDEQKDAAKQHVSYYYEKLGLTTPWGEPMLNELLGNEEEIKKMSLRDIEQTLKDCGASDSQAKCLISKIKGQETKNNETELDELAQVLQDALK